MCHSNSDDMIKFYIHVSYMNENRWQSLEKFVENYKRKWIIKIILRKDINIKKKKKILTVQTIHNK